MGVQRDKVRGIAVQFVLLVLLTGGLGASVLFAPTNESALGVARAAAQGCLDAEERALLEKINEFRKRNGRKPLRLETQLMRAAEHHAEDMTGMRKVVGHTLSDGTSSKQNLLNFGYPADEAYTGENLAAGWDWDTAREAFNFWRHSRDHRKNMLNRHFRAIGIARVYDAKSTYRWYWVTTFGSVIEEPMTC